MESLGGRPDGLTSVLTLFSISNALGRVLAGWAPEKMLHSYGTPRCAWGRAAQLPGLQPPCMCRFQAPACRVDCMMPAHVLPGMVSAPCIGAPVALFSVHGYCIWCRLMHMMIPLDESAGFAPPLYDSRPAKLGGLYRGANSMRLP